MRPFFIINPNSANGATRKRFLSMEPALRKAFPDLSLAYTEGPLHAVTLAEEASGRGEELVVACGGDGTLNEVVGGLTGSGSDTILAVMPSGTGGDFKRMLGLGRHPTEVLEYLREGVPRKVDTGLLEYVDHDGRQARRAFMNIASCGISGQVDHYVNSASKALGGKVSFFIGSLRGMLKYRNVTMKVTVDGETLHEGPTNLVAAGNGRFFGGGMMVAPGAALDDGLLDVVVFGDLSKLEFTGLSNRIYAGRHLDHPKIKAVQGKVLVVESEDPALIDLDGEQVGSTSMKAEIRPSSLRLLVPKSDSDFPIPEGAFTSPQELLPDL